MKKIVGLLVFFIYSCVLQAQSISGIVNTYTPVTNLPVCNPCAGNCNTVTVVSTASFSVGDRVLIIQMKGASTDLTNTSSFGEISNYAEAGNYEFKTIQSIAGSDITFTTGLSNTYNAAGLVQLVRVPVYANPTVTGVLTAQPWNGMTGGILAIEVTGTLTLSADIDLKGLGFRGGISITNGSAYPCGLTDYFYSGTNYDNAAPKGEGIAEILSGYDLGKGAYANGGGGGNSHNGGGGGGSNGGSGGNGGNDYCSGTILSGGVGGYQLNTSGGAKAFLGGGGGAGHQNNDVGTSGGNGGGLIFIKANQIAGNTHVIDASGASALNTTGSGNDGAGGGGAGGTIKIETNTITGALTILSNGGKGGDMTYTGGGHAPGGGGGGGVICTSLASIPALVTTSVVKGNSGIVTADGTTLGAHSGMDGVVMTSCLTVPPVGPKKIIANLGSDVVLCNPISTTLNAGITGSWYTYKWYLDGILLPGETGSSIIAAAPGEYKVVVSSTGCLDGKDSVDISTKAAVPNNTTFCAPPAKAVTLSVTGTGKYKWWDAATGGTALAKGSTYTPTLSATSTFYVEDTATFSYGNFTPVNMLTSFNNRSGGSNTYMAFNALSAFTIDSVTLNIRTYNTNTDNLVINLRQKGNPAILATKGLLVTGPCNCTKDYSVQFYLGFAVPPGNDYYLEYATGSVNVHWDGSGASYPYSVPDIITITGSVDGSGNALSWAPTSYGFFYNWKISAGILCKRVPVTATLFCPPPTCVKPNSVSVQLGAGVNDTLCAGSPLKLQKNVIDTSSISSLNGFYFSWRKINGAGSVLLTTPSKTYADLSITSVTAADSGDYYLVVQDGLNAGPLCKDSAAVKITINKAPSTKGLIESHQELCLGSASSVLTELAPPKNYLGNPVYHQWYTAKDSTGTPVLTKITGATAVTYNAANPTATLYYVRKDSVKYCAAIQTNFVKIRVNNSVIPDKIVPIENDTLCEAIGSIFQLKGLVDSIGKASLNKGYYFTWMKLQQPATVPVVVGTPGAYADYPPVSRLAVEADSGTYYLIVQDGAGATVCMDTLKTKIVVYKTCTVIPPPCKKPISVSIKVTGGISTLCSGSSLHLQLDVIDTLPNPTGGYYFSWVKENALGITVLTGPSLTYADLQIPSVVAADSGRYYLAVQDGLTATASCITASTAIPVIIHEPITTPAVIAKSDTICEGTVPVLFTELSPSSGSTGTPYRYQWYESADSFKTIAGKSILTGETLKQYQAPALSATTYFVRIDSAGNCPAVATNIITIQVDKKVVPGSIGNDTVICAGNPVNMFLEKAPSSGGIGTYSYQWQQSSDNIIFNDIIGATNKTYQSPNIFNRTYFRRLDASGVCTTAVTDTITVDAVPGVDPGTTSSANPSICYNTIPPASLLSLSGATGGTGGPGSETYQWQQSADLLIWNDIPGATSLSYTQATALTDTTYYRRRVGMGSGYCDTSYTIPIAINVYAPLQGGTTGNDATVCDGTSVSLVELVPASGGGEPGAQTYTWAVSSDKGSTWTVAPGIVDQVGYTSLPLSDTTWFRRIVTAACGRDSSNIVVIRVDSISHPEVTINDGVTCEGVDITLTATATNVGTSPTFTWQKGSSDTGPWTTISSAVTAAYTITNPQTTDSGTVYKVIVSSSDLCNSGDVDITVVLVVPKVIVPVVTAGTPATLLCDTVQSVTYTAAPVQGQGTTPLYQWYDAKTNLPIAGATNSVYTPAVKPATGDKVYVQMTSDLACANPSTAVSPVITLEVRTKPVPLMLNRDTTVCTPREVIIRTSGLHTGNTVQWYKDGVAIPLATNSIYIATAADFPGGLYTMQEDNGICATYTDTIKVKMLASPSADAGTDIHAVEGETINLNGAVSANTTNFVWSPGYGLSDAYNLQPSLTVPSNNMTYTLIAYNNSNLCSTADLVTIYVEKRIRIPNVITVNGDGVNDTWDIESIENFPDAEFLIYNRWGNLVWKSAGYSKQWDGTNYRNGEVLPDGTYFYIIDLHSVKVKNTFTGWVQLVK
ncbi:MAG: gliding motility-associated C-terminal domain-containing protein [Cytophaga sp.]|uniref:gliding motility-associated C-terminal domain-containing protein n=1 Tax=Cytophaga sp. TaxID=29535 RepID=UPI003F7DCDB1